MLKKNGNILVSVCMTTYMHEDYIADAIEGVVMQKTTFPFELVIGEDCGTDKTREICKEYQQKYPHIIQLNLNEKNAGAQQNFLNIISSCQGKYIAICEGDDYWTDNYKLQKQVGFLESHPGFSLCSTAAQRLYYGNFIDVPIIKEELVTEDLLTEDWGIMTATIVFRKDALDITGWFCHIKNGDYALQLLVSLKGKLGCLPDTTSVYRQHLASVSNSLTAYKQASWLIYLLWEFNKYTRGQFLKEIKTKVKRVYKNQMRFAKETKLKKAYCILFLFSTLSSVAPFLIKNFRK